MGPLGVQNGMPEWTDFVEGLEDFRLSVLRQEAEGISTTIGVLESPETAGPAITRRWIEESPSGLARIAVADGPRRFMLCETAADQRSTDSCRAVLTRHREVVRPGNTGRLID